MHNSVTGFDLNDVYDADYTNEIDIYRHYVKVFVDQIFVRHYQNSGLIETKSYNELTSLDFHPSLTAYHFTCKMLEYFIDKGDLVVGEDGFLKVIDQIRDEDPDDAKLDQFLNDNPDRQNFFNILRNIRDVAHEVIIKGEDALLTMANDNFREAMKLWEDLMVNAKVKRPCHELVHRALKEKMDGSSQIRIFEGGAGVGSIMRDGLNDPEFANKLEAIEKYFYTDISLSLIKIGREKLREMLPQELFDHFVFKVANLDKLFLNGEAFTRESSIDVIVLEHVLYDVIDLGKTLELFHKVLKPGGYLVFTMAYRTTPNDFFLFEYLQSTFQSYNKAKLEPGFRENIGYLTNKEWEALLKRAGFERYEVYPEEKDQTKWPYGGIIATPLK